MAVLLEAKQATPRVTCNRSKPLPVIGGGGWTGLPLTPPARSRRRLEVQVVDQDKHSSTAPAVAWLHDETAKHREGMAKKKVASTIPKLAEGERELLSQMQDGYRLETDSLGGNPVLRRLKDGDVIRPAYANAGSVKALQARGLIHATKGRDPLAILWGLSKK